MAFNLADERLGTKVETTTVARDGHEVQNLISKELSKRNRGFLAEYFVRCPVAIKITFPTPIDIFCIDLDVHNDRHSVDFIELLTERDSNEVTIGKWRLNRDLIVINNSSYTPNKYTQAIRELNIRDCKCMKNRLNQTQFELISVGRTAKHNMFKAKSLTIKLLNAKSTSFPVLKSLDIYGQPSLLPNQESSKLIEDTISEAIKIKKETRDATESNINHVNYFGSGLGESSKSSTTSIKRPNSFDIRDVVKKRLKIDIPTDFIDKLTCDIMSVPMTLPCGETIDKQTLERFIENERTWGRHPSDPFTGKVFTSDSQPVQNVALKMRIEKFLADNSTQLLNNGQMPESRALGRIFNSKPNTTCVVCDILHEPDQIVIYKLPCLHFICKNQLSKLVNPANKYSSQCKKCSKKFNAQHIERYHY